MFESNLKLKGWGFNAARILVDVKYSLFCMVQNGSNSMINIISLILLLLLLYCVAIASTFKIQRKFYSDMDVAQLCRFIA